MMNNIISNSMGQRGEQDICCQRNHIQNGEGKNESGSEKSLGQNGRVCISWM